MKYKALIFDLDGTAIPNRADGMPSEAIISSVLKAQKIVSVSAATGRTISYARPVLKALQLTTPCIISGGTEIINPRTENILWEKLIGQEDVRKVIKIFRNYPLRVSFSDEKEFYQLGEAPVKRAEHIIYIMDIPKEEGGKMLTLLQEMPSIAAHVVRSYNPLHVELHVTHSLATKEHAILLLLDMLSLNKEEVIGVGDSNNDIPLLQSVGFKVAMGNATEEVKKIADYIAPSVEENGIADVIEKFIINKL